MFLRRSPAPRRIRSRSALNSSPPRYCPNVSVSPFRTRGSVRRSAINSAELLLTSLLLASLFLSVTPGSPSYCCVYSIGPERLGAEAPTLGGVAGYLAAFSTSLTRTRPPEPVPLTSERFTPSSPALRRAASVAFTSPSSSDSRSPASSGMLEFETLPSPSSTSSTTFPDSSRARPCRVAEPVRSPPHGPAFLLAGLVERTARCLLGLVGYPVARVAGSLCRFADLACRIFRPPRRPARIVLDIPGALACASTSTFYR